MKIIDIFINKLIDNKYYQYIYFLAIFFLLLAITVYFFPIHAGHDLNFHLVRFDALVDAIKDGSFPVYLDHKYIDGYGYGTKWFYSDFVLIPFAYLALHVNLLTAYQIMLIFYTVLCGFLSYLSVYKVFKNKYIAFIFCVLYTFSYYRLYDTYNRATLGETICLTFLPLVIWGAYEIIKGDYKKWYIIAIAFSLMIFSHVNTPAIVAFMMLIFLLICYKSIFKEPIRLVYLALAAVTSILLTAYFLFPFVEQLLSNDFYYAMNNERSITFPVQNGEPVKYIIRGLFSGITYVVPEIAGVGVIITFCILLRIFLSRDEDIRKGDLFLLAGFITLLIISPIYPWKIFPFSLIGFIQFSWRFYCVTTVIWAIAGAVYFYKSFRTDKRCLSVGIPAITIFTILVISNSGQVFTNERPPSDGYSRQSEGHAIMGAEYLPQNVPNKTIFFEQRANDSIRSVNKNSEISNFERGLRGLSFDVSTQKDILELPLIYYKGYKATLKDKQIEVRQSKYGLVEIPLDEPGHIKVYFGGTLIQNISPYITLVSIILLIGYIIWFNRKNKNGK